MIWTLYPAVADPWRAVAGTRSTFATDEVVTVTTALMPDSTVAGGLVSVTVTVYVTTPLELPAEEATGTICVSVPFKLCLAAVTATVAAWPVFRPAIVASAKLALATIGPTDSSIAWPDGALTPARMFT